jgi:hypothetical protein
MDNRCTATAKSTGERCQRPAIKGGNVCYQHGGASPKVQKKAQKRLDEMADSVTADVQQRVEDLLDVYDAADADEKPIIMREIRQLWRTVLDRTGHGPTETQEVTGGDGEPLKLNIVREVVTDGDE